MEGAVPNLDHVRRVETSCPQCFVEASITGDDNATETCNSQPDPRHSLLEARVQ